MRGGPHAAREAVVGTHRRRRRPLLRRAPRLHARRRLPPPPPLAPRGPPGSAAGLTCRSPSARRRRAARRRARAARRRAAARAPRRAADSVVCWSLPAPRRRSAAASGAEGGEREVCGSKAAPARRFALAARHASPVRAGGGEQTGDPMEAEQASPSKRRRLGRSCALCSSRCGHSATRMLGIYLIAVYSSRWCVRSSHWRQAVPSLGLGSLYPLGSHFSIRRHVGASGEDIAVSRAAVPRRRHYPSPLHTAAPFCRCCTPAPCLRPPRAAA